MAGIFGRALRSLSAGSVHYTAGHIKQLFNRAMSPRQRRLNKKWAWYLGANYADRKFEWDGSTRYDDDEHNAISASGVLPPDHWRNDSIPLRFRNPSTPLRLVPVIVNRFSSLLFSEKTHPTFYTPGVTALEDIANVLADQGRLWARMAEVRRFGGSVGSGCVGFKFVQGEIRFEVHDPRWTTPKWKDKEANILENIEIKYLYPQEVYEDEKWINKWYWHRRVINEYTDTVYLPVLADNTADPAWKEDPERTITHGYGFCPVVWVQNEPLDGIDGIADCEHIYDTCESIDTLLSQAQRGVSSNCDPTLVIASEKEATPDLMKGSGNALDIGAQGKANYLEISGSGPQAARELAMLLRAYALEVAQCVIDSPQKVERTATEIERMYAAMLSRADVFREQYGERCVLPLMRMVLRAVVDHATRGEFIYLPPKTDPENPGALLERVLPLDELVPAPNGSVAASLGLRWGPYFPATVYDAVQAANAAKGIVEAGVLDRESVVRYVAPYFGVQEPDQVMPRLRLQEVEFMQRRLEEQQLSLGIQAAAAAAQGVDDGQGEPAEVAEGE